MRGMKWIVGSSDHGCWLGSYEYPIRKAYERYVGLGSIVLDIGAHVGYYTLLASKLVGPDGHVYAFEPLPENVKYLHRHLELNRISNVTLFEGAVSDKSGEAMFRFGPSRSMGKLADSGDTMVKLYRLDDLVQDGIIKPPHFLKIDVEGAERLVLEGANQLISDHKPTMILETHGLDVHRSCLSILKAYGYRIELITGQDIDHPGTVLAV